MALIGIAIKRALSLQKTLMRVRRRQQATKKQEKTFLKLIAKAQHTAFGRKFGFEEILWADKPVQLFRERVPVFDYDSIHEQWWYRTLDGEEDVTWPGKVMHFALSSGTSGAPSKKIPVTQSMIRSIRKTSVRQILSLAYYDLPPEFFEKGIFMLGGSTDLQYKSGYYEGDLSGINAAQIPFWFQAHYKPGKRIAKERDWEAKLDEIVKAAKDWDIGIIVGVPAWIQIALERIISHYGLKNIHELWPNLKIFVHGGVFLDPYKPGIEKLLGQPLYYIETYLASEGFIAFQGQKDMKAMEMVLNNGIFFEFIPFNEQNFNGDGSLKENHEIVGLEGVQENTDYALLLSTCAGAWRYMIGDTIRFTDLENSEIIITGRIKHFLSICGEHLSVDNMNQAVLKAADDLQIGVSEFCVAGEIDGRNFKHKWFIGTDDPVNADQLRELLDANLKALNDDYAVERRSALKEMTLEVLPVSVFYEWMRSLGKEGGQHKFPRVLKKDQLEQWEDFIRVNKA
ncbi:MAG: GH3 auxin-responsive promoter family protein [Bacteroidia bacterium]|nr:GH3 auxin-responsive promoter family protein [Bacteroidia bacterium]MCC6768026.1 GH3 auxin-responsive promoter family protein [Bacteroidia bacterium]